MKMDSQLEKEFADFGVYKAGQFSKYNVLKNFIFEVKTIMGTHQVKKLESATSHYTSRYQLASHYKATVSSGLQEGEILLLRQRQL